ncbi:FAD-dependent oxidoreductase [Nocardia seriolae]|uniref:FAD-dependent oxidoreductase n=1 Tax=Nocardia seriolae TaxID=37332 RepID=UPI000D1193B6|nr:FAD-dependent oxidoreductase [Nocardia seriolae]PSK28714.1 4Fe-4S ferredoxin [Nocardia seriolae]QUN15178.1 FAD-dependent oxidoreductase [Nocardia seriolae]
MPYVVTQPCCNDASCVVACPVNCIHPAPGEPGFATAEMLYVDPRTCVDCGNCATACSVDAIVPHTTLTPAQLPFLELNAAYYEDHPHADRTPLALAPPKRKLAPHRPIRVAVVGAGPAGLFAADELLKHVGVAVDVFDRLPTPYGLVRSGVAPDHQAVKGIARLFGAIEGQPGFAYHLGVEVGRDVSHHELADHYHAVIYAVGAPNPKALGIEGEELAGSVAASDLVAWYNGHPDHVTAPASLDTARAVAVGNGNVALDIARILTVDPERLAHTDIADDALAALRTSDIREVVVLSRRGPESAACTIGELIGLAALPGVDVGVDTGGTPIRPVDAKTTLLAELAARPATGAARRIVLKFHAAPVRLTGSDRVSGIEIACTRVESGADGTSRVAMTEDTEVIDTGLVLHAIGHRARRLPGLPFDDDAGTIAHQDGRVRPGVYVAGWAKRGPSGYIGTNKGCAEQTVTALLDDLDRGLLPTPGGTRRAFETILTRRAPRAIGSAGWRAIDSAESVLGSATGRPRVKFTTWAELESAARPDHVSSKESRTAR